MTPDKIRELISRAGGYRLSEGVSATLEGLVLDITAPVAMAACISAQGNEVIHLGIRTLWRWLDAAKRLRYREGEPWCDMRSVIVCYPADWPETDWYKQKYALHRLAAILCDDADAFRVLHWCIHNLGDK